ncbi:MAG: hypothetical protein ACRD6X_13910 [Pyrinomonadaceae bacterium]
MPTIEGSPEHIPAAEFRPKIQTCLDLLRTKAGAYSTWLNSYNLKIRAAARSGANFGDNAIDIARATFDASNTWLASVIIHEAIHFWQYRTNNYQAGVVAEREANRYQLGVLQLLGAPQDEITHMQSQTGGHADLNGDGVYDWQDYEQRGY